MYDGHMPRIVDSLPSGYRAGKTGPAPRYDWPTAFDGRIHCFGLDEIPSTPRNFRKQVAAAAKKFGVRVRVVSRAAEGVYVQRIL
jgi:hypothetical protein